ncbi:neuronal acetylcholine receptor subunit alpha-7-like isoform X1 [Limulus polyphemus]|uniref:Neuronal acetylcholine receptor subunit alpha-7-like isoform X1 n=1 Tax=Limulus polyphemus TaxID=6850 RepID=A0ABM1BVQ0_LIMPO|nr:neuronal acetylcholine receptor subunit alpha-7-like isoform X1 [Limulus polyphemus]
MKMVCRISGVLISLLFFSLLKGSEQGPHERRLINDLLRDYNVMERPVANESEPLLLSFGLTLQQLIDVDEKNQIVTSNLWLNLDEKNEQLVTNLWLTLEWVDVNLRWNVSQYGGIRDIRIAPKYIWKPDVLMYNSADERIDSTFPTNVVVQHNGSCSYIPPGIFKSTCKIDITWFPFDDQKCVMKFGSWTYDGNALDLLLPSEEADLSTYIDNGEWDLRGFPGVRNLIYYTCCPEPYVDITFTLHIRRRTLYYGFNLIIPCVLISSMALLGFALPPDSGEKLTLGVTILLSLTVFLLLVAETMPPTSDAVPLIGTYFACTMVMVAFSVVMTVVVLNYHHRNSDTHEMPQCIKSLFLVWLPWILRMSRPSRKMKEKRVLFNKKMKELELKERSSRSLLANVLEIDDDFRTAYSTPGYLHVPSNDDSSAIHSCITTQRELSSITRELRFITNHLRDEDGANEIIGEWKFAAMVIDRVCLIMFTIFTMVSTFLCLFSAPHLSA